jgi:hypothetical protein
LSKGNKFKRRASQNFGKVSLCRCSEAVMSKNNRCLKKRFDIFTWFKRGFFPSSPPQLILPIGGFPFPAVKTKNLFRNIKETRVFEKLIC